MNAVPIGDRNPLRFGSGRDARLEPGREHFRRGRFALAAACFEAESRVAPAGADAAARLAGEARLGLGLARVHAGDHGGARHELERALRQDPANAAAAQQLARVLLRCGESSAALEWIEHAAQRQSEGFEQALVGAVALESLGRRDLARRAMDRALVLAIESPLLGRRRRGRRAAPRRPASADDGRLGRLAAAHPLHADLRCRLAVRMLAPRPAEAAAHLEAALALNPRYLRARLALGLIHLEQGRGREAAGELEAAREMEPTYPDVRAWLGLARLAAGDAHGAVAALERAIALRREFARAHRHLALAYHALGRIGDALRAARRGVIRDTEVPYLGPAAVLPGLEAEAADEDQLARAIAIRPDSPDLHLALGRRRWEAGDPAEARRAFRDALSLQSEYASAALELARAELALARVPEAESLLADLVGWRPGWVDALALLGRSRLLLGKPRAAVIPLRAALRRRPDLEPARADLSWALLTTSGRRESLGTA